MKKKRKYVSLLKKEGEKKKGLSFNLYESEIETMRECAIGRKQKSMTSYIRWLIEKEASEVIG